MNLQKNILCLMAILIVSACNLRNRSIQDFLNNPLGNGETVSNQELRLPSAIVVCRSRQCAPAKLSMSKEYLFNSLLHLLENNTYKKVLLCQADPTSKTCLENYITLPITAGITPTHAYIDHVKLTDVIIGKNTNRLNLVLNYNLTYGGQTPDCTPAKSMLFARSVNHVVLEDAGYNCKMTSIGQTNIKTIFAIDYVDLDYGYIGGHYSIGFSGPAHGGGSGYMIMRLPKNAYPLSPALKDNRKTRKTARETLASEVNIPDYDNSSHNSTVNSGGVEIFPISK